MNLVQISKMATKSNTIISVSLEKMRILSVNPSFAFKKFCEVVEISSDD